MFIFDLGPSYNQPKLSPCATWNSDAITFADNSTVSITPISIFVNINNTVYVTVNLIGRALVWLKGDLLPTRTIAASLNNPCSIFASSNGDIYIDNGLSNGSVDKWALNGTSSTIAMHVNGACFGLFIDIYNYLYCSIGSLHQVVKKSLDTDTNQTTVIVGTGIAGSASNSLHNPRGIFVTAKLDLYIADCTNNRIQLFQSGQFNGITVAGNGAPETIALNAPTDVVLDADEYLFISDYNNNRIVKSGPSGFECLFGCSGNAGSTANQLNRPHSLSFNNYGNLFVVDSDNNHIQKFLLTRNSCGKYFHFF